MRIKQIVIISIIAIIIALLPLSVFAADGNKSYNVNLNIGDKVKVSKNTVAEFRGYDNKSGKPTWKTTIEAPIYSDVKNNTKINASWTTKTVNKESVYTSNANLFYAEISGQKVTLNKGELSWIPTIEFVYLDGKRVTAKYISTTLLPVDYINANYKNNIVRLTYKVDNITIYRDLRLIEGVLCEYYKLEKYPQADIYITQNAKGDTSKMAIPSAWDTDNKQIKVNGTKEQKIIYAKDISVAKYPIIIEPSVTYYTDSNDGWVEYYQVSAPYILNWQSATGLTIYNSPTINVLGQYINYMGTGYNIMRTALYFDTSGLSDDAVITGATLSLYAAGDNATTNFDITIQNGMPTYPSMPLQYSDYNKSLYSGNGGTITSVGWLYGAYRTITLNATGISWINTTGTTKFMLRNSREISGIAPTNNEYIYFYAYEMGVGYRPKLDITYTATYPMVVTEIATNVACVTGTMVGELTNTGGGTVTKRGFVYGTATKPKPVDGTLPAASGYTTNFEEIAASYAVGVFTKALSGLTEGQTYYYRAFAFNPTGYSYGADEYTFTCWADPVVSTADVTNITSTAARLQSVLVNMNGQACQVRFGWGTVNQGNNITAYANSTSYSGSHETGATPYLDVTGLVASTTYYFNIQAINDCGNATGTVRTFLTESLVGTPTNVVAIPDVSSVILSWSKGSGATKTVIRYKVNDTPTSETDGQSLYDGIDSTITQTGLTPGTDYGYYIVGYDVTYGYSSSAVTIHATTLAGVATTTSTMSKPTNWSNEPDATNVLTSLPFSEIVKANADSIHMPVNYAWSVIMLLFSAIIGFMAWKMFKHVWAVTLVMTICFAFISAMGLSLGWLAIAIFVIGTGSTVMMNRSNI